MCRRFRPARPGYRHGKGRHSCGDERNRSRHSGGIAETDRGDGYRAAWRSAGRRRSLAAKDRTEDIEWQDQAQCGARSLHSRRDGKTPPASLVAVVASHNHRRTKAIACDLAEWAPLSLCRLFLGRRCASGAAAMASRGFPAAPCLALARSAAICEGGPVSDRSAG